MTPYIYSPLTPSNVTHHGLQEYKPGLREGVSHMFENDNAQIRVPANFEDNVAAASGLSGNLIEIYGLQKFSVPLIRLLILEPGSSTDPICCSLEQCDLREKPQYEALSYVWGGPTDMTEITCSGHKVPVRRNLDPALRVFRYPDKKRVLWVDALCINQQDKAEVNAQVKIMGHIYSCAQRVLVWLGVEHKDDSQAIQAIRETVKLLNKQMETHEKTIESVFEELISNPKLPIGGWQHIGTLFSRPYFQRLWVIQEVVNSTSCEVFYGDQSIQWDDFKWIASLLGRGLLNFCPSETKDLLYLSSLEESNILIINDLLQSRKNNEPGRPFFDILFHTHKFQATDPLDNLFSILNLPRYEGEWIPIANYELSHDEVFRDFAVIDLIRNKSVKILSWVNTGGEDRSSDDTLPSWVPGIDDLQGPPPSFFMECGRTPGTASSTNMEASINDEKTVLKIKGRLLPPPITNISIARSTCYTESEAEYPLRAADFANSILEIEHRWFKSCFNIFINAKILPFLEEINTQNAQEDPTAPKASLFLHEITSLDVYKRFILTMCRNWNPLARSLPTLADLENTRVFTETLLAEQVSEEVLGEAKDKFLETYRVMICQEHTKWKRMAELADTRIGWVPKNAREGDRVCVFSGGRESFLLREVDGGEGVGPCYKLLGECYVEGLEIDAVELEGEEGCEEVMLMIL